jgi:hypothetical protein
MNQREKGNAKRRAMTRTVWIWSIVVLAITALNSSSYAEQPPAPCFPNPHAARDRDLIFREGAENNFCLKGDFSTLGD